ncbi:Dot/Icm T4SS effector AnkH/LegA3 [Legionella sp. W05-934-2]|jgi:hypothetical protein|uniref:Dot/Icm T4SS effector AnkH/LegA3 n=1 Tax=Legionella sp. W05-934-2 TaxID=1198649 RepID=UPI0034624A6B
MTLAQDIINGRMPDFEAYLNEGESLDDIDEYGFTPLIECAIARRPDVAEKLLRRNVEIEKTDVTGRTALFWAVDNEDKEMIELLVKYHANVNSYTQGGMPILVYPILRHRDSLKRYLLHQGANLDFALDYVQAKLLGHRFELRGDVDIVNAKGEFVQVDYEGFILGFTVDLLKDSLIRFVKSYATKHLKSHFSYFQRMIGAFEVAQQLLNLQYVVELNEQHRKILTQISHQELLILPAASRGHAMAFVRLGPYWAKIDRGENAKKEGSVNIYRMNHPEAVTGKFIETFLMQKQPRHFFHRQINDILGLVPIEKIPLSVQISGNCSWANIQGIIPVAYVMQSMLANEYVDYQQALSLYEFWMDWDKDRAIEATIYRFSYVNEARKASLVAMLAGVLYQACDAENANDLKRAEKILPILHHRDFRYVLTSYLEHYCIKRLTKKGNNLLKILDDLGYNPNIGINPIATGLKDKL